MLENAVLDNTTPRRRKRKSRDLENLRSIVMAVAANLAYVVFRQLDPPSIAVLLARPTEANRYGRKGFRQLPAVLERLDASGFLTLTKSRKYGRASRIEPTLQLIESLRIPM